ncbi:MAG: RES family NAD+ phosphorylase [Marinoscillum sp.]
MRVYRITLEKYAHKLVASGRIARWNSNGVFVIYASSSRSLACLENVVHRSGEGLNSLFRTMIIDIPDDIPMAEVSLSLLKDNWRTFEKQSITRRFGDQWVHGGETAVLKVPSAIVSEEYNYLINPAHPDFVHIRLSETIPFEFDSRLR